MKIFSVIFLDYFLRFDIIVVKPLYISSPTLDARYSGYWNPLYTSLISGLSSIVNEFTIPASAYAQSYEHVWKIMNSYKFEA